MKFNIWLDSDSDEDDFIEDWGCLKCHAKIKSEEIKRRWGGGGERKAQDT
jgi:hypothetical protein